MCGEQLEIRTLLNITFENVWSVGWQRVGRKYRHREEAFALVQVNYYVTVLMVMSG